MHGLAQFLSGIKKEKRPTQAEPSPKPYWWADELANPVTSTDAVRVTGEVNALTISSNMACLTSGVTISNMYNMGAITTPNGEGLYLENNQETIANNGTITNDLVLPGIPERWRVLDENGLTVQ